MPTTSRTAKPSEHRGAPARAHHARITSGPRGRRSRGASASTTPADRGPNARMSPSDMSTKRLALAGRRQGDRRLLRRAGRRRRRWTPGRASSRRIRSGLALTMRLVGERLHAPSSPSRRRRSTPPSAVHEVAHAGVVGEQVVDAGVAAQVEEDHPQPVGLSSRGRSAATSASRPRRRPRSDRRAPRRTPAGRRPRRRRGRAGPRRRSWRRSRGRSTGTPVSASCSTTSRGPIEPSVMITVGFCAMTDSALTAWPSAVMSGRSSAPGKSVETSRATSWSPRPRPHSVAAIEPDMSNATMREVSVTVTFVSPERTCETTVAGSCGFSSMSTGSISRSVQQRGAGAGDLLGRPASPRARTAAAGRRRRRGRCPPRRSPQAVSERHERAVSTRRPRARAASCVRPGVRRRMTSTVPAIDQRATEQCTAGPRTHGSQSPEAVGLSGSMATAAASSSPAAGCAGDRGAVLRHRVRQASPDRVPRRSRSSGTRRCRRW